MVLHPRALGPDFQITKAYRIAPPNAEFVALKSSPRRTYSR